MRALRADFNIGLAHDIRKNLLQVQQVDQKCFALEIRFER